MLDHDTQKIIKGWCIEKGHSSEEAEELLNRVNGNFKENGTHRALKTIYEYQNTGLADFVLYQDKCTGKYELFCEELIWFDSRKNANYFLSNIFEEFTSWMHVNGYSTVMTHDYHEIFKPLDVFNTKYDSISDAYSGFKKLLYGFLMNEEDFEFEKLETANNILNIISENYDIDISDKIVIEQILLQIENGELNILYEKMKTNGIIPLLSIIISKLLI